MKKVKNIKIMKEIFKENLPDYKFTLLDYLIFSKKDNLDNLYIGNKFYEYINNGFIMNRCSDGKIKVTEITPDGITLFWHRKNDHYYMDILDNNKKYENINNGLIFSNKGCNDLENLKSLIKEKKERGII